MVYDIIIVGGGPAGLNAALYASRSSLSVLVLEKMPATGGFLLDIPKIENWLGEKSIAGRELATKFSEHAKAAGAEIRTFVTVMGADLKADPKVVKTNIGNFEGKSVIIATGTTHRKLGVPGEEEFAGRGVSYCATCDGTFFKGKNVAVVGGGKSALTEALYLAKIAESVTIIHRREEFRADRILIDTVKKEPKIKLLLNSVVTEILGNGSVNLLKVKNVATEEEKLMPFDGVFIYVGLNPNTALFNGLDIDENGFIITDKGMMTNIPGVFAAGDVRAGALMQVITAAADGAIAAVSVGKYMREMGR